MYSTNHYAQVDSITRRDTDLERVVTEGQRVRDTAPSFHMLRSVLNCISSMYTAAGIQNAREAAENLFRAGMHIALVLLKPAVMPAFTRASWEKKRLVRNVCLEGSQCSYYMSIQAAFGGWQFMFSDGNTLAQPCLHPASID
jgi:hypothetical protein